MARNTHSQEVLTGTSDSYTEHETTDPVPPVTVQRAMIGELIEKEGDEELVGTDSSESSENELQSSERSTANPQEPARTTESPSGRTGKAQEDSSARSTVGGGHGTAKAQSGRKINPRTTARKANIRSTDNDEDEFSEFS